MKVCPQDIKIYLASKAISFHGMIIYYQTKDSKFHQIKWVTLVGSFLHALQLKKPDYISMGDYTSTGVSGVRCDLQNTTSLIKKSSVTY